jgi:hypothetical protein
MCSGCFVIAAKAIAKRSIVPLPLFLLPSISIMTLLLPDLAIMRLQIINKRPELFRNLRGMFA